MFGRLLLCCSNTSWQHVLVLESLFASLLNAATLVRNMHSCVDQRISAWGLCTWGKKKTQIFSTDAKRLVLPPTLVWRLGRLKSKERRRAGNYALHLFNKLEPRLRVQETTQSRAKALRLLPAWSRTLRWHPKTNFLAFRVSFMSMMSDVYGWQAECLSHFLEKKKYWIMQGGLSTTSRKSKTSSQKLHLPLWKVTS